MADKSRFFTAVEQARSLFKKAAKAVMDANSIATFDQDANALAMRVALEHAGCTWPADAAKAALADSILYVGGNTSQNRQALEGKGTAKAAPAKLTASLIKLED